MGAYGLAWLCNVVLFGTMIMLFLPRDLQIDLSNFMRPLYLTLGFLLHLLAMVADGIRGSNAPWARKSILIFWGGLGLVLAVYVPLTVFFSM